MQPFIISDHSRSPRKALNYPGIPTIKEIGNFNDDPKLVKTEKDSGITVDSIKNKLWPNALKFVDAFFKDRLQNEEDLVQDLQKRNGQVKQIFLKRYPENQIVQKADLDGAIHLDEDADVFDAETKQCILRLRKRVIDPEIITKLASYSLLCLPRGNLYDFKKVGNSNLTEKNKVFDPSKPSEVNYRKGVITKFENGFYTIEVEGERKKSLLYKAPPGRIGKVLLDSMAQGAEELKKSATYSRENHFDVGETVIVPMEYLRYGVYGMFPANNGQPVRLTRDSESNTKAARMFARGLYFVHLSNLIFKAIFPESQADQQAAAEKGPHLNDWAFSTYDVNINIASDYHEDHNSVLGEKTPFMTALLKVDKNATDNFLILPKYNLAVHGTCGDYILFNAEVTHGNPFLRLQPMPEQLLSRASKDTKTWGTWPKCVNPDSYALSFIAYLKDSLANAIMSTEAIKKDIRSNPFQSIALHSSIKQFERKPAISNSPIPNLPWATASDSTIHISRNLSIVLKPSDSGLSEKEKREFILKQIKAGLTLIPATNNFENFSKGYLDPDLLKIHFNPKISNLVIHGDLVTFDLDVVLNLSKEVTSEKFKSLFTIDLYGTALCEHIFVMMDSRNLEKKLNQEVSVKTFHKAWLQQAWWWKDIETYFKENPSKMKGVEAPKSRLLDLAQFATTLPSINYDSMQDAEIDEVLDSSELHRADERMVIVDNDNDGQMLNDNDVQMLDAIEEDPSIEVHYDDDDDNMDQEVPLVTSLKRKIESSVSRRQKFKHLRTASLLKDKPLSN